MDQYLQDYIAAYRAANPEQTRDPVFEKRGSWLYMTTYDSNGYSYTNPYQKKRILQMTERLRQRVIALENGEQ